MKFKSACTEEAGFEAARWGPSAGSCESESEGRHVSDPPQQPQQGWEMGIVFIMLSPGLQLGGWEPAGAHARRGCSRLFVNSGSLGKMPGSLFPSRSLKGSGPGLGTEHLSGALCSGTGSPALGLCSP